MKNGRGDCTNDLTEIKRTVKEYYELCVNKLDYLEKLKNSWKLLKLNQEEIKI